LYCILRIKSIITHRGTELLQAVQRTTAAKQPTRTKYWQHAFAAWAGEIQAHATVMPSGRVWSWPTVWWRDIDPLPGQTWSWFAPRARASRMIASTSILIEQRNFTAPLHRCLIYQHVHIAWTRAAQLQWATQPDNSLACIVLQSHSIRTTAQNLATDKQTTWSKVLPEKLTGPQLVNKFPAFYGTRRFITALTTARHLSLSWDISIQSMPTPIPLLEDPF
jgi:hypothetical protein